MYVIDLVFKSIGLFLELFFTRKKKKEKVVSMLCDKYSTPILNIDTGSLEDEQNKFLVM
jgi:hypothetical protein